MNFFFFLEISLEENIYNREKNWAHALPTSYDAEKLLLLDSTQFLK